MNSVVLIGRLTRDPETRYATATQTAVCKFTVAVNERIGDKETTSYPRVVVFGKQAENCERYLAKGRLVGIQGRLQTGSYTNKDGATVYTTDVVADRVEFLEWGDRNERQAARPAAQSSAPAGGFDAAPEGFSAIDEDIPF